ncbi:MAG: hypothetical protein ACKO2L_07610 [Planctomycetaceae bacterium]
MTLSIRPSAAALTTWDVAGDLLSFLRCGLQYRYSRPGKPCPSHSAQQFSGRFLQQVLEDAWLHFKAPASPSFPWPDTALQELMDHVEQRLAAHGVRCQSALGRHYTRLRAAAAVNELGPLLFPLLCHARLHVRGGSHPQPVADSCDSTSQPSWELTSTIHAIARLEPFNPAPGSNPLLTLIQQHIREFHAETVELIVDFQGNQRPDSQQSAPLCDDWTQIQIHAASSLYGPRTQHPVVAGMVCYLSELVPSRRQFRFLRQTLLQRPDDPAVPSADSLDARILRTWKPRSASELPPLLSLHFRLQRTIRIIPISSAAQQATLHQLASTIRRINRCRSEEQRSSQILSAWELNPSNPAVCNACDARTWCPGCSSKTTPALPGIARPTTSQ